MTMVLLRAFWQSGVLGRCPNCGHCSMFEGFFSLPEQCACCGILFADAGGAWLGGIAIGYAFGALFVILAAFVELLWSPLRSADINPIYAIGIAAIPVTVLAYRPAKGIWWALLWAYGFMRMPGETTRGG
ncbi:MAG: DUF983 domain-containing protein [Dehalococcoidia bacterium]|nr:DUF983 domain-containing protein [Dehalococcoidia bacterium]